MFKMPVLVVIESLKAAKDEKSNNYADFLFTGGSISIPIDRAVFDQLKPLEGSEVTALFQMKPFQAQGPLLRQLRGVIQPLQILDMILVVSGQLLGNGLPIRLESHLGQRCSLPTAKIIH